MTKGTLDSAEEAAALHFTVDHRLVQSDMIRLEVELDLLFCDFSCLHPTNQSSEMLGNLTILCSFFVSLLRQQRTSWQQLLAC